MSDARAIARLLSDAYRTGLRVAPPSSTDPAFDLTAAYAVERELVRMRREAGHHITGWKVGFANKALWRVLKLETLVWAPMYDDTVHVATGNAATLLPDPVFAPKIEPEIVFALRRPLSADEGEPAAAMRAVESISLGFEIIDCPFPDWRFRPEDFVAAFGLHVALVVGDPLAIDPDNLAAIAEALPRFTLRLLKDGEVVEEGSGRNALRSPLLCLMELATAMGRRGAGEALSARDLVSSGTLTDSCPLGRGHTWRAEVSGLALPALTLHG